MQAPSIGMTHDSKWSRIENDIMENFFVGRASTGNIYGGYGKQKCDESCVEYDLKVGEHSIEYENIGVGKIEKIRDEFIDDAFIVDFVRVFDRIGEKDE